ncbi:MAG: ABC transporter substrate-binding protein [Ilumatobacteraceae bacterium]
MTRSPPTTSLSLGRNMDPAIPGFYGAQYANVAPIDVTDERTVTVTMSSPDYFFRGVLASSSAWIVQKSFVEAAGADFGNPTGRTMCSGSYQLGDWSIGSPLQVTVNENYWDPSVKPLVASIEFVGAPDPIALSAAIQAGDIDGYYAFASIPTLNELRNDPNVTVTDGAGYQFDALLIAPREGSPLADVRVRQALSKAIDRQGYIDTVLAGAAQIPKSWAAPGTGLRP